jgi:hypothetical protein
LNRRDAPRIMALGHTFYYCAEAQASAAADGIETCAAGAGAAASGA